MKLGFLFFAILILNACSTVHKTAKVIREKMVPKSEFIDGCEGEVCNCTNETKTNQDVTLYSDLSTSSKIVVDIPAGTEGHLIKSIMKVRSPGRSKVMSVEKESLGVKKGDILTYVTGQGEGFYKAKFKDQWIEFAENELSLKEIEKMKYEQWGEFQMGSFHGFANVFPFLNCLE